MINRNKSCLDSMVPSIVKKPRFLIPTVLTLSVIAFTLVAFSPMYATADSQKHYDMPEIIGSLTATGSVQENLAAVSIGALEAGGIAEEATGGQVIKGGLTHLQGYLVHVFIVVSDDIMYHVIVDAGNGEVLYTSDGISLEEFQAKMTEMKSKHPAMSGNVDYPQVLEPTGNEELDALRAEFGEKIQELKEVHDSGDFDKVQELRDELKDIRHQIVEEMHN